MGVQGRSGPDRGQQEQLGEMDKGSDISLSVHVCRIEIFRNKKTQIQLKSRIVK